MTTELRGRLDALADATSLLGRHGLVQAQDTQDVIDRARARLRHGTDHTVAALAGSTGSGKSSLLNAIAGTDIARPGVTRPTTSVTQAVTFGIDAETLLDQIGVSRRHHLAEVPEPLRGLVLLDLPDFDSVAVDHRLEVDRLIGLVDLMVWVTDPQKYADELLHVGYLQPQATHADVIQVVLNKADTMPADGVQQCLRHLTALLADDGLGQVQPVASSTVAAGGVDELRGIFAAEVTAKEVATQRIDADITREATRLRGMTGSATGGDIQAVAPQVVDGLASAAGVEIVADVIAAQYRRDAVLATGWPPLRFVRRIRRSPVARLETTAENPVAEAEVSRTLRTAGRTMQAEVGESWGAAASDVLRGQIAPVTDALDRRFSRRIQSLRQPPRWWSAMAGVQTLLIALAVVGGVWLIGVALAESLLLIDASDLVPRFRGIALPTALLIGGIGLGLLVAVLSRAAAGVLGRRHAGRAVARLRADVEEVAQDHVLTPLAEILADVDQLEELLDRAEAGPT